MNLLIQNEDVTEIFLGSTFREGEARGKLNQYIDVLGGAGINQIFWNVNARCTNYSSDVWDSQWKGYDPDGPDDQPFLQAVGSEREVAVWRGLIHNMWSTHNDGIDYPAHVIERSRLHGMVPWLSVRMNDVHFSNLPDHPAHGTFWRSNPQFHRQRATGWQSHAFDYAHKAVRDHFRVLIEELLNRYDMEGIELDFMRDPLLFSVGEEREGGRLLTAWMREIRELVDAASKRRGRPVKLGVRVPSHLETAVGLGMDVATWGKAGIVDLMVLTLPYSISEMDTPVSEWRKRLQPFSGDLAGCMDSFVMHFRGGKLQHARNEKAYGRGGALRLHQEDLDALYLFNYFQPRSGSSDDVVEYQTFMKSLVSMETLKARPRKHAVTYRPLTAPEETYEPPLPVDGKVFSFELPLGPKPEESSTVSVILNVEYATTEACPAPEVRLNSVSCSSGNKIGHHLFQYWVAATSVSGDNSDRIEIRADDKEIRVWIVEVLIEPQTPVCIRAKFQETE